MLLLNKQQKGATMNIIHVVDGTIQKSINGAVIQNEQFYQILQGILERKAKS
jgi:hypothetical protein